MSARGLEIDDSGGVAWGSGGFKKFAAGVFVQDLEIRVAARGAGARGGAG